MPPSASADQVGRRSEHDTEGRGRAQRATDLVHAATGVIEASDHHTAAWVRELQDSVIDYVGVLPDGTNDADAKHLLLFMTELAQAVQDGDEDGAELLATKMDDCLRRIVDRQVRDALDDPQAAVAKVLAELGAVSAGSLAQILGVSTKTLGKWRAGEPVGAASVPRLHVVARCVDALRTSMTRTGVVLWFEAPTPRLDDRSPRQALDDDVVAASAPLLDYATGGRG